LLHEADLEYRRSRQRTHNYPMMLWGRQGNCKPIFQIFSLFGHIHPRRFVGELNAQNVRFPHRKITAILWLTSCRLNPFRKHIQFVDTESLANRLIRIRPNRQVYFGAGGGGGGGGGSGEPPLPIVPLFVALVSSQPIAPPKTNAHTKKASSFLMEPLRGN
jgi:hypothetical protein